MWPAPEGLYAASIAAEVSPGRLAGFFSKDGHADRIAPERPAAVIFTVQDLLADPPFSRLDLVSRRNLLIYLRPGRGSTSSRCSTSHGDDGILLLGSSETVGTVHGHFEVMSKSERLYRRIGHSRRGDFGLPIGAGENARVPARPG